jgi:hypothetical protein
MAGAAGCRWASEGGWVAEISRGRSISKQPLLSRTAEQLRPDLAAVAAMAAFCVGGLAIAAATGDVSAADMAVFLAKLAVTALAFTPALIVAWHLSINLLIQNRRAGDTLRTETAPRRLPGLIASSVLLGLVVLVHGVYAILKRLMPQGSGFSWDRTLADLDASIHRTDLAVALARIGLGPAIRRVVELNYAIGWVVVCIALMVAVCMLRSIRPARPRYLLLYLFIFAGLGIGVASLTLSGGPIFFADFTGDGHRFAPLAQLLETGRGQILSAVEIRDYLHGLYVTGTLDVGTGISAFPSVHIGMVTLLYLVVAEQAPRFRWLAAAFGVVVMVSSVALGWHYAIDGYASFVAVLLANAALKRVLPDAPAEPSPPAGKRRSRPEAASSDHAEGRDGLLT